jgi:hypothetical protein
VTTFPLGEQLADEVLSRRDALPLKPAAVTLTGRFVRLEPTNVERDAGLLFRVSNGEALGIGSRQIESLRRREADLGATSGMDRSAMKPALPHICVKFHRRLICGCSPSSTWRRAIRWVC